MKRDIIRVKMPFRTGHWVVERDVPFLFKIMTLEMIAEYLDIPLEKLFDESVMKSDKIPLAFVYCGYLAACKETFQKPKYKEEDAIKWDKYMPKDSRDLIMGDIAKLLGSMDRTHAEIGEKKK